MPAFWKYYIKLKTGSQTVIEKPGGLWPHQQYCGTGCCVAEKNQTLFTVEHCPGGRAHHTHTNLFPPLSNLFIWILCKVGGCLRTSEVEIASTAHVSLPEQQLERFVQKSKISDSEHVWPAAMQLVKATCRPDVTHLVPSTPMSLRHRSVDFPVGWDTSSLLEQTNNRPDLHRVDVCMLVCGFLFSTMFVCASSKMNEFLQQTATKQSRACVTECSQEGMCLLPHACLCVCVCVCMALLISNYHLPLCWSVCYVFASPGCWP